jgi:uncharacterized delta-60 repeat protein
MRRQVVPIVLLLAMAVAPATSQAGPRDLDRTFGAHGIVLTPIGSGASIAEAVTRQRDGKLVVVGDAHVPGLSSTNTDSGSVIARYRPDGALDKHFGGGTGIVLEQLNPDNGSHATAVAIQRNGKILVSGSASDYFGMAYVARYRANGARDQTFGTDGVARFSLPADSASVGGIAVQTDGKILVAGTSDNSEPRDAFVARLSRGGHLDSGYGKAGVSILKLGNASPLESRANSLVLVGGRAVIAGMVMTTSGSIDLMLARLDRHGTLDKGFGNGGVVQDPIAGSGYAMANDVAYSGGKLVVAGEYDPARLPGPSHYLVARYLKNGKRDATFNSRGLTPGSVLGATGTGYANPESPFIRHTGALAVNRTTGAITITGSVLDGGKRKLLLDRYTKKGVRDPHFQSHHGAMGPVLLAARGGAYTTGTDVLLDPFGKTVVVGTGAQTGPLSFLISRFGEAPVSSSHTRGRARHR